MSKRGKLYVLPREVSWTDKYKRFHIPIVKKRLPVKKGLSREVSRGHSTRKLGRTEQFTSV